VFDLADVQSSSTLRDRSRREGDGRSAEFAEKVAHDREGGGEGGGTQRVRVERCVVLKQSEI